MATVITAPTPADPYAWLENVLGKRALAYVEAQNAITLKELEAEPDYAKIKAEVLAILNSHDRIPYVSKRGTWYYNFWQDAANPRGLWRRTTLDEYRKPHPAWETVIDVDALAKQEHENWVWGGVSALPPKYERALVSFSRGGGDAKVVREFNLRDKKFVPDGFHLPEAKSDAIWRDENTLYVGTDFGPGSLTDSGYPRIVKRWLRGTPLAAATTVFTGEKTDVSVGAWVDHTPGFFREGFAREVAFYNSRMFLSDGGETSSSTCRTTPSRICFASGLTVQLRTDWKVGGKTYTGGALVVTKFGRFSRREARVSMLFKPEPRVALQGVSATLHTWCSI